MPGQFEAEVMIHAPAARVWRALVDPGEVVRWDGGVEAPEQVTMPYPRPGQHARWRYRLGPLRLTLHDRPMEVAPERCLRSRIRVGPFQVDEIYLLTPEGEATRLRLKLTVWVGLALLGPVVDVFVAGRVARSSVRDALVALQAYCEERWRAEQLPAKTGSPEAAAGEAAEAGDAAEAAPEASSGSGR